MPDQQRSGSKGYAFVSDRAPVRAKGRGRPRVSGNDERLEVAGPGRNWVGELEFTKAALPPTSACLRIALEIAMSEPTLFAALGGEPVLRAIVERFVDRMFDDLMIGYLFRAADRERVKAKEYEFAARHLGAAIEYTGRAVSDAHRVHRITGGHFMRRVQLLKETWAEFGVPERVTSHWLDHTLSLQSQITDNALDQCDPLHTNRSRPSGG